MPAVLKFKLISAVGQPKNVDDPCYEGMLPTTDFKIIIVSGRACESGRPRITRKEIF